MTKQQEALFLELSQELTGVSHLSAALAQRYLTRMAVAGFESRIAALLEHYETLKRESPPRSLDELWKPVETRTLVQQIIVLWYSSALVQDLSDQRPTLQFGTPDEHFQALLWDAIGAHPPALSGGYFGHWHYPPEN